MLTRPLFKKPTQSANGSISAMSCEQSNTVAPSRLAASSSPRTRSSFTATSIPVKGSSITISFGRGANAQSNAAFMRCPRDIASMRAFGSRSKRARSLVASDISHVSYSGAQNASSCSSRIHVGNSWPSAT